MRAKKKGNKILIKSYKCWYDHKNLTAIAKIIKGCMQSMFVLELRFI